MFHTTPNDPDERIIITEGSSTRIAKRKHIRYKLLLLALSTVTKRVVNDGNRQTFFKIAWCLGEAGEVDACQAIMKEAEKKPEPTGWYMGYHF